MTKRRMPYRIAVGLSAGLLAAYATGPAHHALYLPAPGTAAVSQPPLVRVDLPGYADRRTMLRRSDDGRLVAFAGHEWAELPAEGVERLLTEHLAAAPGMPGGATRVDVRFTRFELEADDVFRARGHWQLRRDSAPASHGTLAFERTVTTPDPAALVATVSAVAADTAKRIAATVRGAPGPDSDTTTHHNNDHQREP